MILIYNTRLNWLDGKNRISIVFRSSDRTFYLVLAGDGKLSNMPKAPTKEGLPITRQAFLFSVVRFYQNQEYSKLIRYF